MNRMGYLRQYPKMYNLVYAQMVKAGVARWLSPSHYYYVNDLGQRVESKKNSVGFKIKVEITHPGGYCLEMKWKLI